MKAYYKTILEGEAAVLGGNPDQVREYKLLEMGEPCCQGMEEALGDEAIGFGEFHDTILNGDNEINFADCRPYPEGVVWDYFAIKFCPFCGEPVSTQERERAFLKKRITVRTISKETYEEVLEPGGGGGP